METCNYPRIAGCKNTLADKKQVCVFVATKTSRCFQHRANLLFTPVGRKKEFTIVNAML